MACAISMDTSAPTSLRNSVWPSLRANSAWTHNRCSTSMPWRKARAASTNWANTSRHTRLGETRAGTVLRKSVRSTAPRRIATSSSKPTGASSPRSSTGAPYLLGADGQGVEHPTYRTKRSAGAPAQLCRRGPPRPVPAASLENAQRLLVQLGSAYWEKPSAPSTCPARPIGTESCSASEGFPPPLPRSCASPPAAVEERPMSAYARYIRRRALCRGPPGAAFADASGRARGPTAPSRPASGKRLLEISEAMRLSSWPC